MGSPVYGSRMGSPVKGSRKKGDDDDVDDRFTDAKIAPPPNKRKVAATATYRSRCCSISL
jgi:hypothetical protein